MPQYYGDGVRETLSIIKEQIPELAHGDCMHEVACKAVHKTGEELEKFVMRLEEEKVSAVKQNKNGKLFLEKDWRPEHLRLIYQTYEDKIVDYYLDGKLGKITEPNLVRAW